MSKNTNLSFLTDYITADITNGRIGINTPSPAYTFDVTGIARTSTSTYLATASGNVGIGTTSPSQKLHIAGVAANNIFLMQDTTGYVINQLTNTGGNFYFAIDSSTGGAFGNGAYTRHLYSNGLYPIVISTNDVERMRILSGGNIGIGTSTPGSKLEVNGNGYFSGALTATGNLTANSLVVNTAIHTYNVTTYYYGQNFTFTLPNGLNSSVDNSNMRMYMIWVWGVNGATEAGCRVWLLAINGPGTAHTATQILGRDANGVTGLSLARTSATEATISSNNNAFIKYVSVMALMSN